jgi:hypothetical protein
MTIHRNFMFSQRILLKALSCLTDPSMIVASPDLVRATFAALA